MGVHAIDEVAVVIPAHNEELLIVPCLDAVGVAVCRAEAQSSVRCRVIVVLDACGDHTADLVADFPFVEVETVDRRNVGAARAQGVARATNGVRMLERLWIANTDADSIVPVHWITHQLTLARGGAALLIGSVRPFGDEMSADQYRAWVKRETADPAQIHVHGANLGVRADVYSAVGGFDPHPEHEDVMLVDRVIAFGAPARATDGCCVATSARRHGRTPGGFAAHLRDNYPTGVRYLAGAPPRAPNDDGGRR